MSTFINTHPGELLLEDFLKPMGISAYRLAKETNIPAQRISAIIKGRRSITADTDLRLARFFGLTEGYWMRAQVSHDIRATIHAEGKKIMREVTPRRPEAVTAA